jgi:hypothetical protein
MENKKPRNSKGELHGYQESYNADNSIRYRGVCKNNEDVGYQEYHRDVKETEFYIR